MPTQLSNFFNLRSFGTFRFFATKLRPSPYVSSLHICHFYKKTCCNHHAHSPPHSSLPTNSRTKRGFQKLLSILRNGAMKNSKRIYLSSGSFLCVHPILSRSLISTIFHKWYLFGDKRMSQSSQIRQLLHCLPSSTTVGAVAMVALWFLFIFEFVLRHKTNFKIVLLASLITVTIRQIFLLV